MEDATWLSPIVIVLKKNGKLRICTDFRNLNAATKNDSYLLPFTKEVLDIWQDMRCILFWTSILGSTKSRCTRRSLEVCFYSGLGMFVWVIIPFGLKNAPLTSQRIVNWAICDFISDFMKIFLDDFSIYSDIASHLVKLRLYFEKCCEYGISLNPKKCSLLVYLDVILGHVMSK